LFTIFSSGKDDDLMTGSDSALDRRAGSSGAARTLVLIAAALVLAGTIWRLAVVLPRDSRLDLPSGVWLTLATDFADGSFYRPLISDDGLGGTRYFPLHFVLHGALIKTGLDPISGGYALTLASALGLLAGAYFLLRQLGMSRPVCAGVAALAFSTVCLQMAVSTIRGDLLPAALNVWGLALAARGLAFERGAGNRLATALLFALAFIAKVTTLFGAAAAVLAFLLSGRRAEGLKLLGTTVALMALFFGIALIASGGRIWTYMAACASGGLNWASIAHAPRMSYWVFMRDPLGMTFVTLAVGALLGSPRSAWRSLPGLALLITTLATMAMFCSPGVSYNHLMDCQVAAVVFFAWRSSETPSWAAAGLATLALAAVLSMVNALFVLRGDDLRPASAELAEIAALTGPTARPLLTEVNVLPIMLGERPWLMDCYSFRVIARKRSDYAAQLWDALPARRFRAVVLRTDPRTDAGREWLREMDFGPGFDERLLADYQLLEEKYGYLIFVPKSQ
jgi:hypothetical protein